MTQPTPPDRGAIEIGDKRDLLHDRRALALIGGGLVVVAAVGLFVVKPLLTSSSSDSSTGTVANAHVHRAKAAAAATPSVTPKPTVAPTPAPKIVVPDPFSPLYVAPSNAGGTSASAAPSAASTTPITQVSTVIVPEPGPTVTKTVEPKAKYTLTVNLVSYSANPAAQSAAITLNGKALVVHRGQFFPSSTDGPYELISVTAATTTSPAMATFMYGDDSITVHEGQTLFGY